MNQNQLVNILQKWVFANSESSNLLRGFIFPGEALRGSFPTC